MSSKLVAGGPAEHAAAIGRLDTILGALERAPASRGDEVLEKLDEEGVAVVDEEDFPFAAPGRVVVRFLRAKDQKRRDDGLVERNGVLIFQESAATLNKNVAEIVDIGLPTDRAEDEFCKVFHRGDTVIANPRYGTEFVVREDGEFVKYHLFRQYEIIGKAGKRPSR